MSLHVLVIPEDFRQDQYVLKPIVTWIRAERDAKETYFDPYVERRGLRTAPYQGRRLLAEEAARRYDRIRQLCPEDVGALHDGLRARLHP